MSNYAEVNQQPISTSERRINQNCQSNGGCKKSTFNVYKCCTATLAVLLVIASATVLLAIFGHFFHSEKIVRTPNQLGIYKSAAVAADNGFCSEIGRDVIIEGGNAVDAAIAVSFCTSAMNPHSAGLGGGGVFTIYNVRMFVFTEFDTLEVNCTSTDVNFTSSEVNHTSSYCNNSDNKLPITKIQPIFSTTNKCNVIDYREAAPLAAGKHFFDDKSSTKGYNAIATPGASPKPCEVESQGSGLPSGELHGLWTAFSLFSSGAVTWKRLIDPTIELLTEGRPISSAVFDAAMVKVKYGSEAASWTGTVESLGDTYKREDSAVRFYINHTTGQPFAEGTILKNPLLAKTLQEIADSPDPIRLFYNGTMAETLVKELQTGGSSITLADFQNYRIKNYSHISRAELQQTKDSSLGRSFDENVHWWHNFLEASKFAYAARSWMGDPDFVDNAMMIAKNLTEISYIKSLAQAIPAVAQPPAYYGADFLPLRDKGTAHASILDGQGSAVSMTTTINHYFGSMVQSPSTGIIWNNEMDDFSKPNQPNSFGLAPSEENFIEPGKRPMSSMAPLVFYNAKERKPVLIIGAAGGSRIISGVAQVSASILQNSVRKHSKWSVKAAVDAPRLHDQLVPNSTMYEKQFPEEYADELRKCGHNMTLFNGRHSVIMAIFVHPVNGTIFANSDFRKGPSSYPAGY